MSRVLDELDREIEDIEQLGGPTSLLLSLIEQRDEIAEQESVN